MESRTPPPVISRLRRLGFGVSLGALMAILWMQGEALGNRLGGNLTWTTTLTSLLPTALVYLGVGVLLGSVWSQFHHATDDARGAWFAAMILVLQWLLLAICAPSIPFRSARTLSIAALPFALPLLLLLASWRLLPRLGKASDGRKKLAFAALCGSVLFSGAAASLGMNRPNPFAFTAASMKANLLVVGAGLVCTTFLALFRRAPMQRRALGTFIGLLWMVMLFRLGPSHRRLVIDPGLVTPAHASTLPANHPDVLLLLVDTLRADHVGATGGPKDLTPAMDALAGDGVAFSQAISPASWTLPAVGSLFTGVLPPTHGADRIPEAPRLRYRSLRPDLPTLAGSLSRAGYHTAFVGTNALLHPAMGLDRGFDVYENWTGADSSFLMLRAFRAVMADSARAYLPAEIQAQRVLGAWHPGPQPQLLVGHFMDPHVPYLDHENGGPSGIVGADPDRSQYEGEVRWVDKHIGALLEQLKKDGSYYRSWVLLLGDHGEDLYERRPIDSRRVGWVDHGHSVADEIIRVPLIIKPPAGVDLGGASRDDPASLVDVMPTLLAALGLPLPQGLAGHDLLGNEGLPQKSARYTESTLRGSRKVALRTYEAKIVHAPEDPLLGPWSFFDLTLDPQETRPIRKLAPWQYAYREELERLEASLHNPKDVSKAVLPDEELEERLRALGYIDE